MHSRKVVRPTSLPEKKAFTDDPQASSPAQRKVRSQNQHIFPQKPNRCTKHMSEVSAGQQEQPGVTPHTRPRSGAPGGQAS